MPIPILRRWTAATIFVAAIAVLGIILHYAARGSSTDVAPHTAHASAPPTLAQLAAPTVVNHAVLSTFDAGLDTLAATIAVLDHQLTVAAGMPRDAHGETRAEPRREVHIATQTAFRVARDAYKRVEGLIEFYAPDVAMALNGPIAEENDDQPAPPLGAAVGFQVVEPLLFPRLDESGLRDAHRELATMLANVQRLRGTTRMLHVTYPQLFETARLELARVTTLGLAGFDSDPSVNAVPEAATALDGLRTMFRAAAGPESSAPKNWWVGIDTTLRLASAYLRARQEFARLDRLDFIVDYAGPAGRAIAAARRADHTPDLITRRVWNLDAATVFDVDALDPTAYSPDGAPTLTRPVIALGERLFNDPTLSGPGTRSCATCHNPARAFTDGRARSMTLSTHAQLTARNTPTLLNAAYQPQLFFDERASSLEDQVGAVLANPAEMASSAQLAAQRLMARPDARNAFARVFAGSPGGSLTPRTVRFALAAYMRSLTSFNSRFDRAARGDTTAITAQERHGFNLFMGKARCGTCHFAPLFNGTSPPAFSSSEVEIIGVPSRRATAHAHLDADLGRGGVDKIEGHDHAFKVPTLRNIALTAPYMHNGAYETLEQVMDFYNRGGGAGIGIKLPTQTLPARALRLTAGEQADVIAFLRTLTDTVRRTR